jgi:hypothetical protein
VIDAADITNEQDQSLAVMGTDPEAYYRDHGIDLASITRYWTGYVTGNVTQHSDRALERPVEFWTTVAVRVFGLGVTVGRRALKDSVEVLAEYIEEVPPSFGTEFDGEVKRAMTVLQRAVNDA